ncbi:MAG: beta-lactamase family protein [Clostridiales bacterium]|nr:beta-lactamase family protein [Clostridiales bacterium]
MKNWQMYRLILRFLPSKGCINASNLSPSDQAAAERMLRRHRCVGATLCIFDETGVTEEMAFGAARKNGEKAALDTVYRAASVSKFVTALCVMKLWEQGKIDLDRDIAEYFPYSLRHPKAPDTAVTLRMLLSHTAGIHDGDAYNQGVGRGIVLGELLKKDSYTAHLPHEAWEYSNLGAGIAGAVMEAALQTDFEALMQQHLFAPLGVQATFYPQKAKGLLADACRILPPQKGPNFNAEARKSKPLPEEKVDEEHHYALAHGNLCITARDLARLGMAGMTPGYLKPETLAEMRKIIMPFGTRAHNLSQGIGTFILQDTAISPRPLYGHQGMAYGAVHGLFFDPERKKGLALLTCGASEARDGVLADLNKDLITHFIGEKHG